jgi:hypothetical protein
VIGTRAHGPAPTGCGRDWSERDWSEHEQQDREDCLSWVAHEGKIGVCIQIRNHMSKLIAMSGDAVFIIVSIFLIFVYTWYMMWTMVKRNRFLRKMSQLLKDAEAKQAKEDTHATED